MGDMSKQQRTAGSIQAMIGQEPFQSLNIRGQAFGRGGLPTLIPQCPAHHVTRRTTDCPGADRVSQAFSQFRPSQHRARSHACKTKEFAKRTQYHQAVPAGGKPQTQLRAAVHECLINNKPPTPAL